MNSQDFRTVTVGGGGGGGNCVTSYGDSGGGGGSSGCGGAGGYSLKNIAIEGHTTVLVDNYKPLIFKLSNSSKTKCQHCGQYGEPRSECIYCGAPIDP